MPFSPSRVLAPIVGAFSRMRQALAISNPLSIAPSFQTNTLRWFRSSDSKIASEIRNILGSFSPRAVGLRDRLLMRDDPDVAFGLAIVRSPMVNLQWTIEGEDPEVTAFVEHVLRPVYRQLALGGSMAMHFGNQVIAKEWEVVDRVEVQVTDDSGEQKTVTYPNAIVYKRFKAIDPRTIMILIDPAIDDWGGVEQQQAGGTRIRVGPDGVVFWSFRRQEVWGNLQGYPFSNQAYDPWYTKNAIRFLRNKYYERRADPPWKGRAGLEVDKGGTKVDGFQFMHDQLAAVKSGGSVLMPTTRDEAGGYMFDAELVQDDKRGDMFQLAIDAESTSILRSMLITDKAGTSDGTGAFAIAKQHSETMAGMLEGVLLEWIEVVNTQVIRPLVELNFGVDRASKAGARMTGAGISAELKQILTNIILQILQVEQLQQDGKHVRVSDRIDAVAIAQQLGVPLKSEDEVMSIQDQNKDGDPNEPDGVTDELIPPGTTPDGEPVPGTQNVQVTQDAVLNGAQIQSAIDIVKGVEARELPIDSGLALIEIMFNLTTDQAKKIMGKAGTGPKPEPVPDPAAAQGKPTPGVEDRMMQGKGMPSEGGPPRP